MDTELLKEINLLNPWLVKKKQNIFIDGAYITRLQTDKLLSSAWDRKWLILTGPRQAGKTTLGKYLSYLFLKKNRADQVLYLSCDYLAVRNWLKSPAFIQEAFKQFSLNKPVIFIDEVQRLEHAGLLLKAIADLKLPIKMIAAGSSQLELRSKVKEFLTGRNFTSIVLPFSYQEKPELAFDERAIFGSNPAICQSTEKRLSLQQMFSEYIDKDIIEILRVGKPDVMQKLITLVAHSSGQLIQYQHLANDCCVATATIQNYLAILENTFGIKKITPFVGNKRSEVTANPIYYFIDNGFRNCVLRNFVGLNLRSDLGLLIESLIFQELYKFNKQHYQDFVIHFWRTTNGAEVDFVLYRNAKNLLPIEVKYRRFTKPTITRALRSFIQAYKPQQAIVITRNYISAVAIENCQVHFIAAQQLADLFPLLAEFTRDS